MEWTAANVAELRRLWLEGFVTNEIGRRLGCNKNSVVSKAHRLMLPRRPSPIGVKGSNQHTRRAQTRATSTAAARAAIGLGNPDAHAVPAEGPPEAATTKLARVATPTPPSQASKPPKPSVTQAAPAERPRAQATAQCCWPIGAPRDPGFRFCERPVVSIGKSYCAEHTRKAYVRPNRADTEQTAQSAD